MRFISWKFPCSIGGAVSAVRSGSAYLVYKRFISWKFPCPIGGAVSAVRSGSAYLYIIGACCYRRHSFRKWLLFTAQFTAHGIRADANGGPYLQAVDSGIPFRLFFRSSRILVSPPYHENAPVGKAIFRSSRQTVLFITIRAADGSLLLFTAHFTGESPCAGLLSAAQFTAFPCPLCRPGIVIRSTIRTVGSAPPASGRLLFSTHFCPGPPRQTGRFLCFLSVGILRTFPLRLSSSACGCTVVIGSTICRAFPAGFSSLRLLFTTHFYPPLLISALRRCRTAGLRRRVVIGSTFPRSRCLGKNSRILHAGLLFSAQFAAFASCIFIAVSCFRGNSSVVVIAGTFS